MLIILRHADRDREVERLLAVLGPLGWVGSRVETASGPAIRVESTRDPADPSELERLPGVAAVLDVSGRALLAGERRSEPTGHVRVGAVTVGSGHAVILAGPCAVEDEEELIRTAVDLRVAGADLLRGGALKPRSSPYSFQGLGADGYRALARAREASGLPVVSEVMDEESLELGLEHVDMLQVGARNMQNFQLLKRLGQCRRPILLKRGLAATLDEWLLSAEYLLEAGNPDVVLCERGIRTFSRHSRFTLDLSVVPVLREVTHLPVIVDPSHATGRAERVPSMARAAVAAGADGVMVEVHADPGSSRSDGKQALRPERFAALVRELRSLERSLDPVGEAVR